MLKSEFSESFKKRKSDKSDTIKKRKSEFSESIKKRKSDVFGKEHKVVLRAIRNLIGTAQNCTVGNWFYESTYLNEQNKPQPMFVMNRDGFSLLAMGLTKKAKTN